MKLKRPSGLSTKNEAFQTLTNTWYASDADQVLLAILNTDKQKIVKTWQERCMMMTPQVEQHDMVPFHDRWVKDQF